MPLSMNVSSIGDRLMLLMVAGEERTAERYSVRGPRARNDEENDGGGLADAGSQTNRAKPRQPRRIFSSICIVIAKETNVRLKFHFALWIAFSRAHCSALIRDVDVGPGYPTFVRAAAINVLRPSVEPTGATSSRSNRYQPD